MEVTKDLVERVVKHVATLVANTVRQDQYLSEQVREILQGEIDKLEVGSIQSDDDAPEEDYESYQTKASWNKAAVGRVFKIYAEFNAKKPAAGIAVRWADAVGSFEKLEAMIRDMGELGHLDKPIGYQIAVMRSAVERGYVRCGSKKNNGSNLGEHISAGAGEGDVAAIEERIARMSREADLRRLQQEDGGDATAWSGVPNA